MRQRQFQTYKFNSLRLKEFDYNVTITPEEAKLTGEIVSLFDNQMFRSIRQLKNQTIDMNEIDELYKERDSIKREQNSDDKEIKLKENNKKIIDLLFIEEYITIVMDHNSHYRYLFKNGLILNGKKYIRFSSSAGQSRVSTVVFIEEEMAKKLTEKLNNGRNMNYEIAPSKFNAYWGLASSATQVVRTPRFCVVPDYNSNTRVKVNWVTETSWDKDDILDEIEKDFEFNRFDGMGLITPQMAEKFAYDLGLDYIPAQWCVRQNFLKGNLVTFDILDFCEKKNNGNYIITDIYNDSIDLRNIDVIISESMFKLWGAFENTKVYADNCEKNGLQWGVSLYTPKKEDEKNILKMNYQYLQALKLNEDDIIRICSKFVDWVKGVSSDNIYYTILFLMGVNPDIKHYNNDMFKCLIAEPKLINDKYIHSKIIDLIKKKIDNACLGDIYVDGNFQVIVSDPYAMMQHVCGLPVTGLLGKGEYYSNYWNERDINKVASARSPLTYRSEWLLLDFKNDEELNYWYKHCYTGIILNVHGSETMNYAGSDFDYDILATTSDKTVIKGVYTDELPVVYEAPKPEKKIPTNEMLYEADTFSFGQKIGAITNKSTSGYALLPLLDKDSEEYKITLNRMRMCTKLQSAQIDKSKIGKEVKGIPKNWTKRKSIHENDSEKIVAEKELLNNILLDRHPYFFIHLYSDTKKRYNDYVNGYDLTSKNKFKLSLQELINLDIKTEEQEKFLEAFYKYNPVIDSDCNMNRLCKYIEGVDFDIRNKINIDDNIETYNLLYEKSIGYNDKTYTKVAKELKLLREEISNMSRLDKTQTKNQFSEERKRLSIRISSLVKSSLKKICPNKEELLNYLLKASYEEKGLLDVNILWNTYSYDLFRRLLKRNNYILKLPIPDKSGDINYLGRKYSVKEINLND